MPTLYPDSDVLRDRIHLQESAAYELLLSLGAVYWAPPRHQEWVERARVALSAAQLDEVRFFYKELWHPLGLMELPVDYPGPADEAAPFIDYIAGLDADTFLFYLWGRIIPLHEIPKLRGAPEHLQARVRDFYEATWPGYGLTKTRGDEMARVAEAPEALQSRLVVLLRAFYDAVFAAELPALRGRWAASLAEQRQVLERVEPAAYLSGLLDGRTISPMYPPGTPLREVRVVPSYYLWRANFEIWGYGTACVIYNAGHTERRAAERDQAVAEISQVAAALADGNRLKILAAIAQDQECYGHKLARLCGISQPAVSRHMGILKRAGLVEEAPSDGRVVYRLCRPALEAFLPQLLHYLDD